jgi:hypothetical protein
MPDDPRNRPPPLPPRDPRQPYLRSKSTPPDGGLKSSGSIRQVTRDLGRYASVDPRDILIGQMRDEIASLRLLGDRLPDNVPESETADTEPPPTRPSMRVRNARAAKLLGKWTFILGALPFIGAAIARKWPQYSEPVDFVLHLVGLR